MTDKQFKKELYYRLWEKLDKIIKERNPCGFDKSGRCFINRMNAKKTKEKDFQRLIKLVRGGTYSIKKACCSDCEYLSEEGCTIKALGCKTYLCPWAQENLNYRELEAFRSTNAIAELFDIPTPQRRPPEL